MEKFRKVISTINFVFKRLDIILWIIKTLFKVVNLVNEEVEKKFGKKDNGLKVVLNNPLENGTESKEE